VEKERTVNRNGTSSGKSQTRFENFERTKTLTETERRQRLHRRAGCIEEEAMSEPTPEERADYVLRCMTGADGIAAEIRAAVEAEREACCAAICTMCKRHGPAVHVAGYWKHVLDDGKLEFFCSAAAIRARGESND
jgi:hypothetical protein